MAASSTPTKRWLLHGVKATLAIAVILFVGAELWRRFSEVDFSGLTIRVPELVLCLLCMTGTRCLSALSYQNLTRGFGSALPLRPAMVVAWVPALAKYIPGKVMGLVGAIYLFGRYGIPARVGGSVTVLHFALTILVGFLLVLAGSLHHPILSLKSPVGLAILAASIAGSIALHPRILGWLFQQIPGDRFRTCTLPDFRHYAVTLGLIVGQWILNGIALWLCLRAVHPIAGSALPVLITASALAMVIGVLAVFAPGGLGVREGILLVALDPFAPPGAVAIAVVTIRLIQILVEVLLAAVGAAMMPSSAPPDVENDLGNKRGDLDVVGDESTRP